MSRVEDLIDVAHGRWCSHRRCPRPSEPCWTYSGIRAAVLAALELAAEVAEKHETCGADICNYAPKAIAIKIRSLATPESSGSPTGEPGKESPDRLRKRTGWSDLDAVRRFFYAVSFAGWCTHVKRIVDRDT